MLLAQAVVMREVLEEMALSDHFTADVQRTIQQQM